MTTRSTSDETQAMQKIFQSIDNGLWQGQFSKQVQTKKSFSVSVPGEFPESLPPLTLERSESADFVDKLLESGSSENLKSGSSLNSKQLHALFLASISKSMERSRGTTTEPPKTSSSTLMNEMPDLNSSAWLPANPGIDNDAIYKTMFFSEVFPQIPSHSQNQSLDARDPEPNKYEGTNWFRLHYDGLPPAAVSPAQSPPVASARTPRKSKTKKPTSRKRTNKHRRPEPQCKVFFRVRDVDVLLGRGGLTNRHPGNQRYLRLKEAMQPRYLAAERNDKTAISQELVDTVHEWGGRFLKREEGTKDSWFEVLDIVAREKASQTLREINTPENRAIKRVKYAKKSRKK